MIKSKRGDTLIEVTIAIGIFSMIAIAVASVMSSGTSGSQMALETTLAREEIDAQAEALRFVHSAFVSSKNNKQADGSNGTKNSYQQLWQKITQNAIIINNGEKATDITQFSPNTCDELYTKPTTTEGSRNDIFQQKAFFLNTKQLSSGSSAYFSANDPNTASKFAPASTYPRLIFTDSSNTDDSGETLSSTASRDQIYRAEGIYIIAVKDASNTQVVPDDITLYGDTVSGSTFYDFYIRTCWYGTDATRPSTISTVVRLYNPDTKSD